MKNLQPIFLIGAMKSGTTSIFKHLELHPEICFPTIKEPEFFSKKMGDPRYKVVDYLSLFNLNEKHRFIFDGSTGYTKYPAEKGVPQRIFEYGLRPKFIYIVRNPFERICSHYNFMIKNLKWNNSITSPHLINVSNYYLQLKQYEPYFSKTDFLIVDFDDLRNDHNLVIKSIYNFLGIRNQIFSEIEILDNKTKAVNRTQLELKNRLGGKFNFLPESIRLIFRKIIERIFQKKIRKLTKKEFNYVHKQLRQDMLSFQTEYGFNIAKWGF